MKKGAEVFMGVPAYSSKVDCETALGLMETVGLYGHFAWVKGCCNVGQARARLLHQFLCTTATTLLMVDSDMVFGRKHLERLLSHETTFGVIAGLYRLRNLKGLSYSALDEPAVTGPVPFKVKGVGTGFIRIERWVIDQMIDAHPDRWVQETNGPKFWDFFPVDVQNHKFTSDDYEFCRLAREAGVDVWADAGLTVGHNSATTLELETERTA